MFAPLTDDLVDDGVDLGLRWSGLADRAAPPVGRVADEANRRPGVRFNSEPPRTSPNRSRADSSEPRIAGARSARSMPRRVRPTISKVRAAISS